MTDKPGSSASNPVTDPAMLSMQQLNAVANYFQSVPRDMFCVGYVDGAVVDISRAAFNHYMQSTAYLPGKPTQQGPMTVSPKTPRGGKMSVPDNLATDKPECPDHFEEMIFDAAAGIWACQKFQCKRTARQRLHFNDVSGTLIGGEIHLFTDGTGAKAKYYIYIKQLNAFLDVDSVLCRDLTGDVHGKTDNYMLGLEFPRLNTPENKVT